MKYTISKIYFNKTKKDGTPYKDGATLVAFYLEGVEQKLSFFDNNGQFASLTIGSTIEGTIVQKDGFWNFEPEGVTPAKKSFAGKVSSDFENLAMKKLDMIVHQNNTIIGLLQGTGAQKAPSAPSPVPVEDDGLDFLTA